MDGKYIITFRGLLNCSDMIIFNILLTTLGWIFCKSKTWFTRLCSIQMNILSLAIVLLHLLQRKQWLRIILYYHNWVILVSHCQIGFYILMEIALTINLPDIISSSDISLWNELVIYPLCIIISVLNISIHILGINKYPRIGGQAYSHGVHTMQTMRTFQNWQNHRK